MQTRGLFGKLPNARLTNQPGKIVSKHQNLSSKILVNFSLDRIGDYRLIFAFVSMKDSSNLPLWLDLQAVQ